MIVFVSNEANNIDAKFQIWPNFILNDAENVSSKILGMILAKFYLKRCEKPFLTKFLAKFWPKRCNIFFCQSFWPKRCNISFLPKIIPNLSKFLNFTNILLFWPKFLCFRAKNQFLRLMTLINISTLWMQNVHNQSRNSLRTQQQNFGFTL